VTTIAPNDGAPGSPTRLIASLLPGQKQTVAIGTFGTAASPIVLEMERTGDALSVVDVLQVSPRLVSGWAVSEKTSFAFQD
jgi:hypothetical protein